MPQEIKGWFLPRDKVSDTMAEAINRIIQRGKQAHFINLEIRINGTNEYEEADWVKHLVPIPKK